MSEFELVDHALLILGTAGISGTASYWLIGKLIGHAAEIPRATQNESSSHTEGRVAVLFSLCDAAARRRGLLRWP